jgi:hypothetical protein
LSAPHPYPDEPPTQRREVTQVVYQSLLSIFDSMGSNERMEFIELATIFRDLSPEDRAYLVGEANALVSPRSSRPPKKM